MLESRVAKPTIAQLQSGFAYRITLLKAGLETPRGADGCQRVDSVGGRGGRHTARPASG